MKRLRLRRDLITCPRSLGKTVTKLLHWEAECSFILGRVNNISHGARVWQGLAHLGNDRLVVQGGRA
jgi:hypothetical protein